MENFSDFLKVAAPHWDSEFKRIASVLFNDYCISANKLEYDILEVEFYYDYSPAHKDLFIYKKTDKNKSTGNWFFHLSGVDLTFGDPSKEIRGGILIRAIRRRTTDSGKPQYIIGPLRTMLEILNNILPIKENGELKLQLIPKIQLVKYSPELMKRKGLPDKPGSEKEYRFVNNLNEIKDNITPSMFKQYYVNEEQQPQ
jgi:hypothetical protein